VLIKACHKEGWASCPEHHTLLNKPRLPCLPHLSHTNYCIKYISLSDGQLSGFYGSLPDTTTLYLIDEADLQDIRSMAEAAPGRIELIAGLCESYRLPHFQSYFPTIN
jgi:hypothetical protein